MLVREMTSADLDSVLRVEESSFTMPWSRASFREELALTDTRYWAVLEADGRLLGFGGIMVLDDEAHLLNLAVAPAFRREGLASALLAHLAVEARSRGASRLTLEVRPSNDAAVALYREAGFITEGIRTGYYPDTHEDALIMWTGDLAGQESSAALDAISARGDRALLSLAKDSADLPRGELLLAIETSCDETAAAVMRDGTDLLSSVVASQVDFHARFGGVVPEIASRKHTEAIVAVVDEALSRAGVRLGELDGLAVTHGPGLVGALVVGVAYAKGLAFATGLPLVGVNHLESHIFANLLADPTVAPPLVALLVSGGHTSLVHVPAWGEYRTLGSTLDDAAGEAFDKVAKALGLGYPGGPAISRLAQQGDSEAIPFPRAMLRSGDFDFSLSGLKTAVVTHIAKERAAGRDLAVADIAASFEAAVVDVQVAKAVRAAEELGVRTFCLAGGVAANARLRESLAAALGAKGVRLSVPPLDLCTDNAAMVAAAAHFRLARGDRLPLDAEAVPNLRLGQDMSGHVADV